MPPPSKEPPLPTTTVLLAVREFADLSLDPLPSGSASSDKLQTDQTFIESFSCDFRPLRVKRGPGSIDVPTDTPPRSGKIKIPKYSASTV